MKIPISCSKDHESLVMEEILKCDKTVYIDVEKQGLDQMLFKLLKYHNEDALIYKGKESEQLPETTGFSMSGFMSNNVNLQRRMKAVFQAGILKFWSILEDEAQLRGSFKANDFDWVSDSGGC